MISSGFISINPAPLSQLLIYIQPSGTAIAGALFATQPVVLGTDLYNNAISSSTITLATFTDITCTTAGALLLSNYSRTSNASGYTTFDYLSYNAAQTIFLKASFGG